MSSIDDKNILELLGKPESFESGFRSMVDTYKEQMYWQIRKMVVSHEDANDVLQLVFIKVFKGIKNFKGDSKLSTWLYRICYNESVTFLKKRAKEYSISSDELLQRLTDNLEADVYFTGDEIQLSLQKALARLPDRQREIFNLRYYHDIKFKEIASILDLSEGAVKSSYHIASNKVKSYLLED
jgi:RNA polymerase sigma-70 factor (ECF subfamily)